MRLILLGPPGVGKDTQALSLSKRLGIPHISTDNLFHEAISQQTPLGLQVQPYLDVGGRVPDDLIMLLLCERFRTSDAENGWILDGFPRTIRQAQALDELLTSCQQPYPRVIYFKANDGILINRLLKIGYAGGTVDSVRRQLDRYRDETAPLIEHYQKRQCLVTINGHHTASEMANELTQLCITATGSTRYIENEVEFEALLAKSKPLIVNCTASWCGPCKLVAPLIDQLAADYSDLINVFKLDLDSNRSVANRLGVKRIPAVLFFSEGRLKETLMGVKSYDTFSKTAERFLP